VLDWKHSLGKTIVECMPLNAVAGDLGKTGRTLDGPQYFELLLVDYRSPQRQLQSTPTGYPFRSALRTLRAVHRQHHPWQLNPIAVVCKPMLPTLQTYG
jgi:hypothetical protein